MADDKYRTKFLVLLRYVPYLKNVKIEVQRFVSGFTLAFKDYIQYDEPHTIEEVNGKLKHCYELSRHKSNPKQGWIGNDKTKGKQDKK